MTQPQLWCARIVRYLQWGAGTLLALSLFLVLVQAQERKRAESASSARDAAGTLAEGRQIFESTCSGCHGLDGRGGERAPDVATMQKTQRRSDAELAQIVANGVPAGGMPAFPMMDSPQVRSLVAYLRLLQGKTQSDKLPGDPAKGRALFSSKARCSECHMAEGKGGFIASDLSSFGHTHSVQEIRDAITKPSSANRLGAVVTVQTGDGQKYSGVVRNEDNFSLQLQTLDGAFHLFEKSHLGSVVREPNSLMPPDYGSTLSPAELNDLVSFLLVSVNDNDKGAGAATRKKNDWDEEEE